ncbi:hypothetical protein HK096_010781 [Nowakowskiella sp. JEL0078]|nr:hypothetical protein HK096_010781 [Nowakowskiella sp. JEL0078]
MWKRKEKFDEPPSYSADDPSVIVENQTSGPAEEQIPMEPIKPTTSIKTKPAPIRHPSYRYFTLTFVALLLGLAVPLAHIILLIGVPSVPINVTAIELIINYGIANPAGTFPKIPTLLFVLLVLAWYLIFFVLLVLPMRRHPRHFGVVVVFAAIHVLGLLASAVSSIAGFVYLANYPTFFKFKVENTTLFVVTELLYFVVGLFFAITVIYYLVNHHKEFKEETLREKENDQGTFLANEGEVEVVKEV